jgi:uncharacterized protein YndB with AHSA1/START domain
MNRVTHFEIYTDDPTAVQPFYENVFGWKFSKFEGGPIEYWLVATGEDEDPGINGGMTRPREGQSPGIINTIAVKSLDQTNKKEFKPQVGFEFAFVVEHKGNTYDHRCKVTEVIPQKKIAYTWRYEGNQGNSLVTIEISPDGDRTRLKLTHDGLETFPKTPAFARENFDKGWTAIVGTELKQFVERKG